MNSIGKSYEGQDIKLDLACGCSKKEGFIGVDISDKCNADIVLDILKFPWPWENDSVAELHSSHFIEHIPMGYISSSNEFKHLSKIDDKDLLMAFFDECYRVLKPGGMLTIFCPSARSNRAFQDPTHRRFIVAETFLYLNKEWRDLNKLQHYNIDCNFSIQVDPLIPAELGLLHPEAAARRINESWNTVFDWKATLIKK